MPVLNPNAINMLCFAQYGGDGMQKKNIYAPTPFAKDFFYVHTNRHTAL